MNCVDFQNHDVFIRFFSVNNSGHNIFIQAIFLEFLTKVMLFISDRLSLNLVNVNTMHASLY